jgi:hypothetical protein
MSSWKTRHSIVYAHALNNWIQLMLTALLGALILASYWVVRILSSRVHKFAHVVPNLHSLTHRSSHQFHWYLRSVSHHIPVVKLV